jgi:polyhydroxyalkanoate synthesis repressor PhaR
MLRCGRSPVLVKKYGNRRLYDTDKSRYITLEDLAGIVRAGEDVRVVDAKTGEDLTNATLAQIIVEGRGAARLLPVPLLVQLIRMGDDALAEFLGQYVTWALQVYLQAREGVQAMSPLNPLLASPFGGAALARLFGFGPTARPDVPATSSAPPEAAAAGPAAAAARSEIAALRKEVEALRADLKKRRR